MVGRYREIRPEDTIVQQFSAVVISFAFNRQNFPENPDCALKNALRARGWVMDVCVDVSRSRSDLFFMILCFWVTNGD